MSNREKTRSLQQQYLILHNKTLKNTRNPVSKWTDTQTYIHNDAQTYVKDEPFGDLRMKNAYNIEGKSFTHNIAN